MLDWIDQRWILLRLRFLRRVHGPPSRRVLPFSPRRPDARAGSIRFQIYDVREKRLVDQGEMTLLARSFTIEETLHLGMKRYRKSIALAGPFALALIDEPIPAKQMVTGLGLTASRTDMPTFCWEWFVRGEEDSATKLQETGTLRLRYDDFEEGLEISETKFRTDVDFRVYEANADTDVNKEPRWRVTVFAGSKIQWPTGVR